GSAEKPGSGGYSRTSLVSTFAAAFPMDKPRYVIIIMLDEPKGVAASSYQRSAPSNAAPIVKLLGPHISTQLGVLPDDTRDVDITDLKPLVGDDRSSLPAWQKPRQWMPALSGRRRSPASPSTIARSRPKPNTALSWGLPPTARTSSRPPSQPALSPWWPGQRLQSPAPRIWPTHSRAAPSPDSPRSSSARSLRRSSRSLAPTARHRRSK